MVVVDIVDSNACWVDEAGCIGGCPVEDAPVEDEEVVDEGWWILVDWSDVG